VVWGMFGHQGQCVLSGAMLATGWPSGSRSHVASHSISEAGRWRCLWNISSHSTGPTLGMMHMLGISGACARSILRSVGREGLDAMVPGILFSIFLHAERLLRRGSMGSLILRRWEMDWIMLLCVVRVCMI
jgi:sugar phosphate permease